MATIQSEAVSFKSAFEKQLNLQTAVPSKPKSIYHGNDSDTPSHFNLYF